MSHRPSTPSLDLKGWLGWVKPLIEGSRGKRLILRQPQGRVLIDAPLLPSLLILVVLLFALPMLTAILALAALFGRCHLTIEADPDSERSA